MKYECCGRKTGECAFHPDNMIEVTQMRQMQTMGILSGKKRKRCRMRRGVMTPEMENKFSGK